MRKIRRTVVIFTLLFAFVQISFIAYNALKKDHKVKMYGRFFTESGFNYYSLINPIQSEVQSKEPDTLKFTHRIIYPLSPNFDLVDRSNHNDEIYIADQIENVVNDSVNRIKYNFILDYDKTSLEVRNKSNPNTITVLKPETSLRLLGTASPEALRYGLKKSLEPGHVEKENLTLAEERSKRTAKLLKERGLKVTDLKCCEVQLPSQGDINGVLADKSVLDSLRYVEADVTISYEKVKVTTLTMPLLLPLWLLLFAASFVGISSIPNRSIKKNWWRGKTVDNIYFIFWIIWILLGAVFDEIRRWFKNFLRKIGLIYFDIRIFLDSTFHFISNWWGFKTSCQKVLIFILPYSILLTIVLIYLLLR